MADYIPAVGDRFELPAEDIHGVITNIVCDDDDEPVALIVHMDNGKWAANVDLSAIVWRRPTIH